MAIADAVSQVQRRGTSFLNARVRLVPFTFYLLMCRQVAARITIYQKTPKKSEPFKLFKLF